MGLSLICVGLIPNLSALMLRMRLEGVKADPLNIQNCFRTRDMVLRERSQKQNWFFIAHYGKIGPRLRHPIFRSLY